MTASYNVISPTMVYEHTWQNTHGNDTFCLGGFGKDFPKNLLFELCLEGRRDGDQVEIKKGVLRQREKSEQSWET